MTRKDFQLIADTLNSATLGPDDTAFLANRFAVALATTNANFDSDVPNALHTDSTHKREGNDMGQQYSDGSREDDAYSLPDVEVCDDCLMAIENGDMSGIESDEREAEVSAGLEKLGRVYADWDSEDGDGINVFSKTPCGCCGTHLAGTRHRYLLDVEASSEE